MSTTDVLSPVSPELTMEPELTTRGPVTRSAANRRRTEPPTGPWISNTTSTSGNGVSLSLVQEKVGEWLGVLTVVTVLDALIMSEEECSLITEGLSPHSGRQLFWII